MLTPCVVVSLMARSSGDRSAYEGQAQTLSRMQESSS
jgi:hypothetical protein